MSSLRIINARAVLPDMVTGPTEIAVRDGVIAPADTAGGDSIDAAGGYVFPGFIDVHVHGGGGADFMDGTPEAFETAVKTHLLHGTTTLLPTSMSAVKEELIGFIKAYRSFERDSVYADCAAGIHMEGPYLSGADGKSRGAQSGDVLRPIDMAEVEELLELGGGRIRRWDAAPELAGSEQFARAMCERGIRCAVAHTDATADEAQRGFAAGFSHVTHFYNAVTMYRKRGQLVTAGVVEAAYLDENVTVELICDGRHVPKQCLQLALAIKGADGVLGITDAMRLAGTDLKSGKLGSLRSGTEVIADGGVAKLRDLSSFAGSVCTMDRALSVLCTEYEISPVTAAKMLASAPARFLGIENRTGAIREGLAADLVITDGAFRLLHVIKAGRLVI